MPAATDEQLELQIMGDIQDVFGTWQDDESSADELETDDEKRDDPRASTSLSCRSDLALPLLRSQTRLSKRTLAEAISSLPVAPVKRARGVPSAIFAPFSSADYLERLASFNLLNFTAAAFAPSAAARAGWSSSGRNRLKCGCCQAAWKLSDFTGLQGVARDKLAMKMRALLRDNHRPSCPWRVGVDLLEKSEPLQLPSAKPLTLSEVRRRADEMRPLLPSALELDHPLSVADLAALDRNFRSRQSARAPSLPAPFAAATSSTTGTADVLAVFQWQLLPSPESAVTTSAHAADTGSTAARSDQTVVTCPLCARRLGLWSFTSTRRLNVVSSHAADCPSLAYSVAQRLAALAEPELTVQPIRKQVREMVDALLGPRVTLDEVRSWKAEVDQLEGSARARTFGDRSRTQVDAP